MQTPSEDRGVRAARGRVKDTTKPSYDEGLSTRSWGARPAHLIVDLVSDVALECGWGRLLFGQTFADHQALVDEVAREQAGRRDVCMYVREPHVVVSLAPQELFLDPSHTYRMWLHRHRTAHAHVPGLVIRELRDESDADAVNRLYRLNDMVTAPASRLWANQRTPTFTYLVAVDEESGDVVGTVTGIDHRHAFNDPEDGTSLWCLAVDPQTTRPGVGRELVRMLLDRFKARGRAYLDLSVLHDNEPAIGLYEQLGFVRIPVFTVKRKNPINELLFTARPWEDLEDLNPYARVIAEEALRRGIKVRVLDAMWGEMELSHGGREVLTRESLSELTTSVAMSRCDDKRVTRRLLERAGLRVPAGQLAGDPDRDRTFLEQHGEVVVKPARGEQGRGIAVGVTEPEALHRAVEHAAAFGPQVLVEQCVRGEDLRVMVIDDEVVGAALRRPAEVVGTGRHTIRELIEHQSRRRAAATDGESSIPVDDHTRATVRGAGHDLDGTLPEGETLQVRRTANLHTGGTIHDVTDRLHPALADAAVQAARVIGIPVVGIDLLVDDVASDTYVIIEANERPGLANHEPQPVVERFVDLLFPQTRTPGRARHRGG